MFLFDNFSIIKKNKNINSEYLTKNEDIKDKKIDSNLYEQNAK